MSSHSLYKRVKAVRPSKDEQRSDELLEVKKENLKLRAELRRAEEERPTSIPPCVVAGGLPISR